MAKAVTRPDVLLVQEAKAQALALFDHAFNQARGQVKPEPSTKPALFPNGIEHLHVVFAVTIREVAEVKFECELSGPKAAER